MYVKVGAALSWLKITLIKSKHLKKSEIRPLTNGKFCQESDNLKPEKTSKFKQKIVRIMNSNNAS